MGRGAAGAADGSEDEEEEGEGRARQQHAPRGLDLRGHEITRSRAQATQRGGDETVPVASPDADDPQDREHESHAAGHAVGPVAGGHVGAEPKRHKDNKDTSGAQQEWPRDPLGPALEVGDAFSRGKGLGFGRLGLRPRGLGRSLLALQPRAADGGWAVGWLEVGVVFGRRFCGFFFLW